MRFSLTGQFPAILLCIVSGLVVPARAESAYSTIYVFGASTVDRGRIPELIAEQDPSLHVNFPPSPPYFDGRFSNGPTYVEQLPALLGIPPAPEQNFAVGGAETGNENGSDDLLAALSGGTVELPGMAEQIESFIDLGGTIALDALVIVHGGGNDYFDYLAQNPKPSPDQIRSVVGLTVGNIENDIRRLTDAGAGHFLVPNYAVISSDLTPIEDAFNDHHAEDIEGSMRRLAQELGTEIVVADFASAFDLLLTDPARFGLTNVTDPCLASAAPQAEVCSEAAQETFLFWTIIT